MNRTGRAFLSAILLLAGCSASENNLEPAPTKEPVKEKNLTVEYTTLPEDNAFYYMEKEDLVSFLEHGTGILFFGFPECPWCQAYLPIANDVLLQAEAKCGYYNIYTDKTEDREFYDEIGNLLVSQNDTEEEIIHYDNDGKQVIFMPLILFVSEGRITAFDNETCMENAEEISPQDYWTEEKVSALKEKLLPLTEMIREQQKENDDKGCDSGCEFKGYGN